MTKARKRTGDWGERFARTYLEQRGYRILETNYRCPYGEIDLVAGKGDCLVFVEVRTRRGRAFGTPEESVTPRKIEHLKSTAEHYLQSHADHAPSWRIDVVALELGEGRRLERINHLENAVG
ncbi:MAG: YraN family protein [Dehalococcoidia bacterium]|nr:YraN family protein [Dehalococcoidia bacterium]